MNAPVILCGLGRVGFRILECLRTAGVPVVLVDSKADSADPRLSQIRVVRGDCREEAILREAGVRDARGVIVATSDDLLNISCSLMVRRISPDVRIVLRMFNQNLVNRLGKAVTNVTALSVSALAAPLLALTATTGDVLAAFPVAEGRRQIAEFTLGEGAPQIGRSIALFDPTGHLLVLAHSTKESEFRLLHEVDRDRTLAEGDRVVAAGAPNEIRRMLEPGRGDLDDVLWAGRIRRFSRVVYRTFAEMDLAVKICAFALVLVVAGSSSIYHFGLGLTWPGAIYRTISVISTGSDLEGKEYDGWGQVFVSSLKMFGTLIVAAFTAIFTNFLIRARLGGAFEMRRIPDSGHVVVIGLGNVGYRVVEELLRMDERVVAIESKPDAPFVPSCRRKGVPVIVGDATVKEPLRQARVAEARAVIAATSSDIVNLEIALLVAELNEKQRVVVRMGDSILAETARTAAGVRMAVSLPELAAPAFLAALIGDRVLSLFFVGGRVLAAIELTVQPGDAAFIGQSLRAIAIDFRIVPVAVLDEKGVERKVDAGYRLQEADRLIAIVTVDDLDEVTQRTPPPAEWEVEVRSFPISVRAELLLKMRALRTLTEVEAEAVVAQCPFLFARGQTRGQADELLAMLRREKIDAEMRKIG